MQPHSPKNQVNRPISRNHCQSGMTLIEITLIISILLGLMTIVFLGITSFNKGAARAKCILQQDKLQRMSLAYANLNEVNEGDTVSGLVNILITDGYIKLTPVCPDTGDYTFLDKIPYPADRFVICSIANHISD